MPTELKVDTRWTHVVGLIDRSGSMSSMDGRELAGAANKLVSDQLSDEDGERRVTATIANFDDSFEIVKRAVDGKTLKITEKDIVPRGMTALIPSIGRLIRITDSDIENWKTTENNVPGTVVFILLSDGDQTRTRLDNREEADAPFEGESGHKNLSKLVKDKETNHQWKFFFLGTNMNVNDIGSKMGFAASTCMNYSHNTDGGTSALRSASGAIGRYQRTPHLGDRSAQFQGFTAEEREASQNVQSGAYSVDHATGSIATPIRVRAMADEPKMVASFSHRQWDHLPWEVYTPEQSNLIDQMMKIVPSGSVLLPDTPFEIRWGDLATSHMLVVKPLTGIIQVNRQTGFTRIVKRN